MIHDLIRGTLVRPEARAIPRSSERHSETVDYTVGSEPGVRRAVPLPLLPVIVLTVVGVYGPRAARAQNGPHDTVCPPNMVQVTDFCIDRYEAPNIAGASPLVMFSFDEAHAWCVGRGLRLCFDDEWTRACAGPEGLAWPYGDTHLPGVCNDEQMWRPYDQTLLNLWPSLVCTPDVASLGGLLSAARAVSVQAAESADHVEWLYQGEGSGANTGCTSVEGVLDLCGNVEEWTRRRDGGTADFHGNLKGRYWAEARSCQSGVTSHGDWYRFYELGFRCCTGGIDTLFSDNFETGDLSAWSSTVGMGSDELD